MTDLQFVLQEYRSSPGFDYDKDSNCCQIVFRYENALFMGMFAFDRNGNGVDCAFTCDDIYAKYGKGRWSSTDAMARAITSANSFETKRYGDDSDLCVIGDPRVITSKLNGFRGCKSIGTVNFFIALLNIVFEKKVPLLKDTPSSSSSYSSSSSSSSSRPASRPSYSSSGNLALYRKKRKTGITLLVIGGVLSLIGIGLTSQGSSTLVSLGVVAMLASIPLIIIGIINVVKNTKLINRG
ncbi:MAG: hypothetical protein J5736_00955 [Bacilli bacterium]|nr:hypothetical protein [Bacilli bacterium]